MPDYTEFIPARSWFTNRHRPEWPESPRTRPPVYRVEAGLLRDGGASPFCSPDYVFMSWVHAGWLR